MMIHGRFLKERLEAEIEAEVFLDSDQLQVWGRCACASCLHAPCMRTLTRVRNPPQDLRQLLDHVRASEVLMLVQSAEVN